MPRRVIKRLTRSLFMSVAARGVAGPCVVRQLLLASLKYCLLRNQFTATHRPSSLQLQRRGWVRWPQNSPQMHFHITDAGSNLAAASETLGASVGSYVENVDCGGRQRPARSLFRGNFARQRELKTVSRTTFKFPGSGLGCEAYCGGPG